MKLVSLTVGLFLAFFLCPETGKSQSSENDSSVYTTSVLSAIKVYHQFLAPESGLYNGSEYTGYPFTFTEGYAYFLPEPVSGSVFYDGVLYENASLLFDLVSEHIVIRSPDQRYQIQLINERISG